MSDNVVDTLPIVLRELHVILGKLNSGQWKVLFDNSHHSVSTTPDAEQLATVHYKGFQLGEDCILVVDLFDANKDRFILHTSVEKLLRSLQVLPL